MASGLGVADALACWPFVRARAGKAGLSPAGLDQLLRRCMTGQAVCLASPRGVVVVTPGVLGPIIRLVVLLAVSDGAPGAFREHEDEMVEVASEFGAHELAFESPRAGWGRMLGKHWAFRDGLFIRSVDDGKQGRHGGDHSPTAGAAEDRAVPGAAVPANRTACDQAVWRADQVRARAGIV